MNYRVFLFIFFNSNKPGFTIPSYETHATLTVWSDTLILVSRNPAAFASAATRLVFPTPGLPSNRIGLFNWSPLNTRIAFKPVVGAKSVNSLGTTGSDPN
jgi:hypothetical protein